MILLQTATQPGVIEKILQSVLKSPYQTVFSEVAQAVVKSCLGIAALFFLIMIGFHIGRQLISKEKDISLGFLSKYFFLMLALTAYIPLMTTIVDPIIEVPEDAVRSMVKSSSNNGQEFKQLFTQFDEMQAKARKDESFGDKMTRNGGGIGGMIATSMGIDFREMFFKLANYIIDFLFDLVSFIVFLIRFYALGILFSIGPIAIAFSFLKPLEGSINGWAKFYLVVHLWVLIIYIIDFASSKILREGVMSASSAPTVEQGYVLLWQMLLVKSGLIIVKVLTPKFADILISGSQGGNIFTAITGATVKAVGQAMGGVQQLATAKSSPVDNSQGNQSRQQGGGQSQTQYTGEHIKRN